MTAAYWPRANEQTECANQAVKQIFGIAHDECLHWFDALDVVEMIINNAPIGPTLHSPQFLNYGFHPTLVPDVYAVTIAPIQATHHTIPPENSWSSSPTTGKLPIQLSQK